MRTETDVVVDHLTKQFGSVKAVDDLSFTVRPGAVLLLAVTIDSLARQARRSSGSG